MAPQRKGTNNKPKTSAGSKNFIRFRFMVTSKFIGHIAFFFVAVIVIYAMYEMHRSMDYSSLGQLIMSAFAFASIYAGFYLSMAKVEHAEEEKTRREIELANMKLKAGLPEVTAEDIENTRQEINNLINTVNNLLSQDSNAKM